MLFLGILRESSFSLLLGPEVSKCCQNTQLSFPYTSPDPHSGKIKRPQNCSPCFYRKKITLLKQIQGKNIPMVDGTVISVLHICNDIISWACRSCTVLSVRNVAKHPTAFLLLLGGQSSGRNVGEWEERERRKAVPHCFYTSPDAKSCQS